MPSNLTYNRHLKTQTGLLNNTTATANTRNKKPMNMPKSTTSNTSRLRQMPKSSTNDSSGIRQVVRTTRIRREVKTTNAPVPKESKLPSILKDVDNSLANKEKEKTEKTEKPKEADKTEKTENVEDKKEAENDNVPKESEKKENDN